MQIDLMFWIIPEYKEIEAELDSYEGMDGKIAKIPKL